MITPVALTIASIISHNYHLFSVVRTVKIYCLSHFQVYNTELLTLITILVL